VDLEIDERAEHVDPVAKTKNGGNVEGRHADCYDIDHRRQDSWHGEWQRDAPQGSAEAHPMHLGGFFQGRVHRAEHLRGQDKSERREAQSLNEAHADRSCDVDGSTFETEPIHQPSIQNADSWISD
jgi:hypothetical protein